MIGIFKASGRRKLLLSTVLRSYQLAVNYGMRYIDSTCCLHRYDFIGEDGIHLPVPDVLTSAGIYITLYS